MKTCAAFLMALALVLSPMAARADDGGPGAEQSSVSWFLSGIWNFVAELFVPVPAKNTACLDPNGRPGLCQPVNQVPQGGGECGAGIDPMGGCRP